jgi:hypothetical protein
MRRFALALFVALAVVACGSDDDSATVSTTSTTVVADERWEGPVTGEAVQADCSPPSVPVTGEIQLTVDPDGTVTGSVTERRDSFTCGGTPVPPFEATYQITGEKTASAFELTVSGAESKELTLPISGTRATATFETVNSGYGATVIYTVDCVTC